MANPSSVPAEMKLYCAAEPKGRLFQMGEPWPGDAWTANPGGQPVGKGATEQAMKDLVDAQATIDSLSAQVAGNANDLAVIGAERDEANGKVADLEQRAIAAETAQTEAEEAARGYMTERDAARADAKRFSDTADSLRAEAERVPGLVEELNAANQTVADLNDKLAAAPAKPAKPAKADAAPTPAAADAKDPT